MPAPLFTLPELDAYPPATTVPAVTAELVLALVTTEIRGVIGAVRYDALTDVTPFKGIALALARRMVDNPAGRRSTSRQIDDYTETDTFASESLQPAELTDSERDRLLAALGLPTGGAFTIRPGGMPDPCRPVSRRRCCHRYPHVGYCRVG